MQVGLIEIYNCIRQPVKAKLAQIILLLILGTSASSLQLVVMEIFHALMAACPSQMFSGYDHTTVVVDNRTIILSSSLKQLVSEPLLLITQLWL